MQTTKNRKGDERKDQSSDGVVVQVELGDEENAITLGELIQKSNVKQEGIVKAFNQGISKPYQPGYSYVRGESIAKNQVMLIEYNGTAQLIAAPSAEVGQGIVLNFWTFLPPYATKLGIHQYASKVVYGYNGRFVINVPRGHYFKAYSGVTPKLYGEGHHVVIDENFDYDNQHHLVKVTDHLLPMGISIFYKCPKAKLRRSSSIMSLSY